MTAFTFNRFADLLGEALVSIDRQDVADKVRRSGRVYDLASEGGLDVEEVIDLRWDLELMLRSEVFFGKEFNLTHEVIEESFDVGEMYEKLCCICDIEPEP